MRACIGRRWRRAAPGRPVRGRCPRGVIGRSGRVRRSLRRPPSGHIRCPVLLAHGLPAVIGPRPRSSGRVPWSSAVVAVGPWWDAGAGTGPSEGRAMFARVATYSGDAEELVRGFERARRARADGGLLERLLLRGSRQRQGRLDDALGDRGGPRGERRASPPAAKPSHTAFGRDDRLGHPLRGRADGPRGPISDRVGPKISHRPRRRAGCGRRSVPRLAGGAHDRVVVRRLDGVASREYPRVQSRRRDSHGFFAWRSRPCRAGDDRSRRPPRCGGSGCAGRSLPAVSNPLG